MIPGRDKLKECFNSYSHTPTHTNICVCVENIIMYTFGNKVCLYLKNNILINIFYKVDILKIKNIIILFALIKAILLIAKFKTYC